MGQPTPISLGYRSNPARNRQAGNARLINCFAEEAGEDGKTQWVIYATAGLDNFGAALPGGGIRDMIVVGSTLYAVAGRNIHAVTTGGASTLIGGIPSDGPVYMEYNRRNPPQIGAVSDGLHYVIDTTANSVSQILDPDLPAPISLSVLDGYGILPVANGRYMLTGLDDFTTVDPLDEGTAEAYPDTIVRSMVLERELVLFGRQSTEWHQNTGGADFPFTRVHAVELGCLAPDSVAKVDTPQRKTLIWVAPDHTVRAMNGYGGQVISTNDIEKLVKDLHASGGIAQLRGFAWADAGRFFYALTCDSWTRVYDAKSGQWHERRSYGRANWRVSKVVQFGDKLIAGDRETGQLYEMNDNFNSEAGNHLIPEIITPHVHAYPHRILMNALYLDAARGVGLNVPSDHIANPKVLVSWSKDSGQSWSPERERTLGAQGQSAERIQPIYRLGTAGQHGVQFRIRIPSPVERVVISAALDFDTMAA